MKKLFLAAILMLSLTVSAQTQERHQYTNVSLTEEGKTDTSQVSCTVYVNYENKPVIKVLFSGGAVYYDSVSEVKEGTTRGGMQFWYGQYQERGSNNMVIVQLFKDESYGIRFIDGEGNMIQFY